MAERPMVKWKWPTTKLDNNTAVITMPFTMDENWNGVPYAFQARKIRSGGCSRRRSSVSAIAMPLPRCHVTHSGDDGHRTEVYKTPK
jgi:hypothetical protein